MEKHYVNFRDLQSKRVLFAFFCRLYLPKSNQENSHFVMNSDSWLILMGYLILNNFNERQLMSGKLQISVYACFVKIIILTIN